MDKNKYKFIAKIALTLIFVAIIVKKIDIDVLIYTMEGYPFVYFIFAFFLNILINLVGAFSLHAVYQKQGVITIFKVIIKSSFYAVFLPGQILGETTKIFMLSSENASMSERIFAVGIDKLLNVIALVAIGFLGASMSENTGAKGFQIYFFSVFFLMLIGMLFVKNRKVIVFFKNKILCLIQNEKYKNKLQDYADIWSVYARQNRMLLYSTLWGVVYQLLVVEAYYILGTGLEIPAVYYDYCWINAILTLILFLPISMNGIGVREAGLAGLFGLLGVESEKAVALSLLLMMIQILRAVIGGVLVWMDKGSKKEGRT